jgi:hypothetical protein
MFHSEITDYENVILRIGNEAEYPSEFSWLLATCHPVVIRHTGSYTGLEATSPSPWPVYFPPKTHIEYILYPTEYLFCYTFLYEAFIAINVACAAGGGGVIRVKSSPMMPGETHDTASWDQLFLPESV